MKRMFEAVVFAGEKVFWDYRLHNTSHYKGFYHWHQCAEMIFVHEGAGQVILGTETLPIRRGMLLFFQPYQLHHVYANVSEEQPYTRTIFHFDPRWIDELIRPFTKRYELFKALWNGRVHRQGFDLAQSQDEIEYILDEYRIARKSGRGDDIEEIAILILRLLDTIVRTLPPELKRPSASESKSSGYVQEAMRWIDEHYQESIHLDDLADALHLSKFYLSKLFREETGTTLKEFITATRMRQACRLLETTSLSVELIGHEVGLPNPSYFVQVFKQEIGTTPHKYRTRFMQAVQANDKVQPAFSE